MRSFDEEALKFILPLEGLDYAKGIAELLEYAFESKVPPPSFEALSLALWKTQGWRERVSQMEGDAKAHMLYRKRLFEAAKEKYELCLHLALRTDPNVKAQKNKENQIAEAEKYTLPDQKLVSEADDKATLAEAYHKKIANKLKFLEDLTQDLYQVGKNMERARFQPGGQQLPAPR